MMGIKSISLLLLTACTSSHWAVDEIPSGRGAPAFVRLSYPASDPIHGIDLEILQEGAYLAVHSTPVAAIKGDPHAVHVCLRSKGHQSKGTAYRLQGGQRFRLSSEMRNEIISYLREGEEITIQLNGYRTILKSEDFEKKYAAFLHPRSWDVPLRFSL